MEIMGRAFRNALLVSTVGIIAICVYMYLS